MKELPTPTFPFSQLGLRGALWPAHGAHECRQPSSPQPSMRTGAADFHWIVIVATPAAEALDRLRNLVLPASPQ